MILKNKMNRKLQIGIIAGAILLIFTLFLLVRHLKSHVHDLPSILETGRLSVLTDSSRMGFSIKGDSVYGFQYEIIKAFADTLGLELVITEESDLKTSIDEIKNGDYDVIANFIPITTEWQHEVLFTNPLFMSRQILVQRIPSDSGKKQLITEHNQLANDTIYVPVHSPYIMRLKHLSDEIASPIIVLEMNNVSSEQMVRLVAHGKIKYTICDEKFAELLKIQYPNIDISVPIGFDQQLAWIVHKKSPLLLKELNSFLDDFIGSEAYWKIYRKYY